MDTLKYLVDNLYVTTPKSDKLQRYLTAVINDCCTSKQKEALQLRMQGYMFGEICVKMGIKNKCTACRHFQKAVRIIEKHLVYIQPFLED